MTSWLEETREILSPKNLRANAIFLARSADTAPVPSARLRVRVCGSSDIRWFLACGAEAAGLLADVAACYGPMSQGAVVCEWGCGCGRVLRHLPGRLTGSFVGCDIDGRAIRWCSANLRGMRFFVNAVEPPLDRASGTIDFLYGLSVMTHLSNDLQQRWIAEARRVLSATGLFAFTFRGAAYRDRLDPHERRQFERRGYVVRGSNRPGTNHCNSYNSDAHIRDILTDHFDIVAHFRQPAALRTRCASTPLHPLQDLVVCRPRP